MSFRSKVETFERAFFEWACACDFEDGGILRLCR